MHLVTGYKTRDKDAVPTVLYCGSNRGKANGTLEARPKDSSLIRVEFVSFDRPLRHKVYESEAEIKARVKTEVDLKADLKAEADLEAEKLESEAKDRLDKAKELKAEAKKIKSK